MWQRAGLLMSAAALVVLLGVRVFDAVGVGWFWLLALVLPVGPAVLLADTAGRFLGWRHRGRRAAAVVLWLVLPAATFANATGSVTAQVATTLLVAVAAGILLMTAIAGALRAAAWLVDRRRRQRGLPSLTETASQQLGRLAPIEQASVVLGGAALLVMATGLGIDADPGEIPDGVIGAVALLVVRFWTMLEAVAISVLAGSVVLFAQARVGLREGEPSSADVGEQAGTHCRLADESVALRATAVSALPSERRLARLVAAASVGLLGGLALRRRGA
jgi:hypothetical protein